MDKPLQIEGLKELRRDLPLADRVDESFGHWLAGFMDGEGCFSISRRHHGHYDSFHTAAKVVVRDDDRAIIEEIVAQTGIGHIFHPKRRVRVDAGKPQIGWTINSKAECVELVALFDRFPLRAKKARDFAIWREAVRLWCAQNWYRGGDRGPADWSGMEALADRLHDVRAYAAVA